MNETDKQQINIYNAVIGKYTFVMLKNDDGNKIDDYFYIAGKFPYSL